MTLCLFRFGFARIFYCIVFVPYGATVSVFMCLVVQSDYML